MRNHSVNPVINMAGKMLERRWNDFFTKYLRSIHLQSMKLLRKDYPRVRQYTKSGNTYYHVDLRRKHYVGQKFRNFNDRDAALRFAAEIATKVAKHGLTSVSQVGVDPQMKAWSEQCAVYGRTLEEAVEVALGVFRKEREIQESPHIGGLLSLWVDDKVSNTLKPLREKSKKSIRNMAETFKEDFGMARIREITTERVEQYLGGKDCSQQYRENLRSYLSQFFNWCRKKKYHDENPAKDIEVQIVRGVPEFYSVDQCRRIMDEAAKQENRPMRAYFALCLFGGVRPDEAERMAWANIDGEEIYIPAGISKTKKERRFRMAENLKAWVESCRETTPLVPATNVKNLRVKVCRPLGFAWIPDGLRHTFATFHYAKHHSLEELRHVMGNSPAIIERFYKGTIAHDQVDHFWSIRPPANTTDSPALDDGTGKCPGASDSTPTS